MNFCTDCGTELKTGSKYCEACGKNVEDTQTQEQDQAGGKESTNYQQNSFNEKTKDASDAFKEAISGKTNIVQRVINIIVNPRKEWVVIAGEQPNIMKLIGGYTFVLALIPALSTFIYYAIIGETVFGFTTRNFSTGIIQAIIQLITAIVGAYLLALVIDYLAPSFESEKNFGRSLQLAVYSSTPQWIAGILILFSTKMGLLLMLISLYSIYILAVGIPLIKQTPKDKVTGYTALTIIAMIVIGIILTFFKR